MVSVDQVRIIVGIIGDVLSGALFASPIPTFYRILKNKSTEEFHPYPYIAGVFNCACWVWYAMPFVHPDSFFVMLINSIGFVLEVIYLIIFMIYATKNKHRYHICYFIGGGIVVFGGIAAITVLPFHTYKYRSMFVGILSVIFGCVLYASPLSIARTVIKTKSAEFMPTWVCLAGFLNGITWFIYAFLKTFDPYIATGNGIGAVFGFIQLSLYVYYEWIYKQPKPKPSGPKPPEVQLNVV